MTNNKLTGVEHNLKISPEYFAAVVAGVKRAELRFNDRNYQIGDVLNLCEWADDAFTGAFVSVDVTHVCELPSVPGYALLSFELQKCRKVDSAEPAPIVPETLPCSVELKPGLIIGKGCKTETLLTALKRRADYYAELKALTPEQRAEHDAGIAEFIESFGNSGQLNSPVITEGWVMVPKEPTRQMMAQGHFAMKGTDRGKFRRIYQAMITAAPALNKGGINAE